MSQDLARTPTPLTGISSRAWEHPADRGALVALRKLRGFDTVIKAVSGLFTEYSWRLMFLGSAVQVDERQFSRLYRRLLDASAALDVAEVPDMFVLNDPRPQALTLGMDHPFIVLHSGLVDLLDDDELGFVIAHELGHALSGHATYQTLLQRLLSLSGLLQAIPVGGVAARVVMAALMEWSRKAELSADRAGLLATQDPALALRAQMQLASGGNLADLDQASFLEQGRRFEEGDLRAALTKVLLVENQTHPFNVVRATELRRWVDSGEYTRILEGDYARREDDADAPLSQAAQDAAASYAESFSQAQDTLGRFVSDLAGWVGSGVGTARSWFEGRRGSGESPD